MAKSEGVNKSQSIRDYYKAHPKAKTSEVVEALAKDRISVSANLVTTVKSKHNTRRRAVKKVVAKGGVGVPELKAALALIKLTGSLKAATQALAVAQEIRDIV